MSKDTDLSIAASLKCNGLKYLSFNCFRELGFIEQCAHKEFFLVKLGVPEQKLLRILAFLQFSTYTLKCLLRFNIQKFLALAERQQTQH